LKGVDFEKEKALQKSVGNGGVFRNEGGIDVEVVLS